MSWSLSKAVRLPEYSVPFQVDRVLELLICRFDCFFREPAVRRIQKKSFFATVLGRLFFRLTLPRAGNEH